MMNGALSSLRAFVAPRERPARCELCAAPLANDHDHLLDPGEARLRCVCSACAPLFPGAGGDRPHRIRPYCRRLDDFELDDATWAMLGIPVGLAFMWQAASGKVVASLPGRAGVVESEVPAELWQRVRAAHSALALLRPGVEALLVRRTAGRRDYFRVSIDHCYRLAGLLRSAPGPMSGPDPAVLDGFFEELETASLEREYGGGF